jgi:hypothetical protein
VYGTAKEDHFPDSVGSCGGTENENSFSGHQQLDNDSDDAMVDADEPNVDSSFAVDDAGQQQQQQQQQQQKHQQQEQKPQLTIQQMQQHLVRTRTTRPPQSTHLDTLPMPASPPPTSTGFNCRPSQHHTDRAEHIQLDNLRQAPMSEQQYQQQLQTLQEELPPLQHPVPQTSTSSQMLASSPGLPASAPSVELFQSYPSLITSPNFGDPTVLSDRMQNDRTSGDHSGQLAYFSLKAEKRGSSGFGFSSAALDVGNDAMLQQKYYTREPAAALQRLSGGTRPPRWSGNMSDVFGSNSGRNSANLSGSALIIPDLALGVRGSQSGGVSPLGVGFSTPFVSRPGSYGSGGMFDLTGARRPGSVGSGGLFDMVGSLRPNSLGSGGFLDVGTSRDIAMMEL